MTAEKELTPEEKLLKVIKAGGAASASAPEADSASAPDAADTQDAPAAAAAPRPVAESPKMRPVLKTAAGARSSAARPSSAAPAPPKAAKAQSAAPRAAASGRPALRMRKKVENTASRIAVTNRFLAAAVLLVVCLSGLEIMANVSERNSLRDAGTGTGGNVAFLASSAIEEAILPPQDELAKQFSEKPVIYSPEQMPAQPAAKGVAAAGQEAKPQKQQTVIALEEVTKNLHLIGVSEDRARKCTEAVIVDKRNGKMFFLVAGQKMTFEQRELELKQINNDSVVIAEGEAAVTVN